MESPSYLELMRQAEQLLAQAEIAKKKEIEAAIAEIAAKMKTFGLTLQDLRVSGIDPGKAVQLRSTEASTEPKYRGPNGELWVGGRGRKPDWALKVIQEKGEKGLEDYQIKK